MFRSPPSAQVLVDGGERELVLFRGWGGGGGGGGEGDRKSSMKYVLNESFLIR